MATAEEPDGSDTSRLNRLAAVMGQEFGSNAVSVFAERETDKGHMRLTGFAGLPTFNRATAQMQYLFVNGRPVKWNNHPWYPFLFVGGAILNAS